MERYLIETSMVDVRMVHHERTFSFGDKSGLLDEWGFLRDPQWIKGLKTLADLENERGAVIIAESGLGKTHVARAFAEGKGVDNVLFIDVPEYLGDSPSLVAAIGSAQDKQCVILDGVDEAPGLAGAIVRGLRALPTFVKRIIFSRGIPELRQFTDGNALPMYSLLPLTQENVKSLAQESAVDGELFIGEVKTKNLGPICAKPLECVALLEMFKSECGLHGNSDELRLHMIRHLCSENRKNPHRHLSAATVSAERCFSYAKKIALILKLSGLSIIKRMDEMEPALGSVDFALYNDLFDATEFNRILLRGLFLPIGADRFRFAHITYFDYLAAHGLMECVAQRNWREILMNGDGLVYPQWENAISWVAASDNTIYDTVFKHQPELLLNSDAAVAKRSRDELCRAVLRRAAQMDYWARQSSGIVLQFVRLVSLDTVDVLREFLWVREEECREMAIDVVKHCRVRELVPELVKLFCDTAVPHEARKSAGYALLWIDPSPFDVRDCKNVLSQHACSQTLKGLVFRLLWPYELSAEEMTPHLTGKEDSIGDSYSMWISDECPKRFPEMSYDDALEMVRWAARDVEDDDNAIHSLGDLKRKVFTYCFKRYDTDEMYDALAVVYETFCGKYKSPFYDKPDYEEDSDWTCTEDELKGLTENRRRLATAVLRRGRPDAVLRVTGWTCGLLCVSDVDYVDDQIDVETSGDVLSRWVECLGRLQWCIQLPERAERWDDLHKRFPKVFKCTAKREFSERVKSEKTHAKNKLKRESRQCMREQMRADSYATNLRKIKEAIKKDILARSFYSFANYCSEQHAKSQHNEWGFHIRSSRVWDDLSADERNVVVLAAEKFLLNAKAPPRKNGNEVYLGPFAAFVLLQEVAPQKLSQFPKTVLHEFRFELMQGASVDESESAHGVIECYCRMFREDFIDAIIVYLQYPRTEGVRFHLGQLRRMVKRDSDLCKTLLRRLDADGLADSQRFELLDEFWEVSEQTVLDHLRAQDLYRQIELLKHPLLSVFSLYAYPDRFSELLALLNEQDALAREWIVSVVGKAPYWNSSLCNLFKFLHTEDLARFYMMIRRHFPIKDAPVHFGAYSLDAIDHVYEFASHLISCIYERKAPEVVQELEMLVMNLPEEIFLRDHLIRARKEALAGRCPTLSVKDIHLLLDEKNRAFLVNTPAVLCRMVLDSLERYDRLLSGKKSHRAKLLWNEQSHSKKVTHKKEEDFSDDMRDFLDGDLKGLILNREVQLNCGRHGDTGARADIWIDAIDVNDNSKLALCIEVKGSWNRSAKNALEKQLLRKYMGEGGADAGILAVGWFDAPAPNKVKHVWKTLNEAKCDLFHQAEMVCSQGNIVAATVLDCRL